MAIQDVRHKKIKENFLFASIQINLSKCFIMEIQILQVIEEFKAT